jgi:hypothetical protein
VEDRKGCISECFDPSCGIQHRWTVKHQLKGLPYEEFQALKSERSGVLKLVQDLNQMLNPAERLKDRLLEDAFETYWPKLDKAIRDLTFIKTPGDSPVLEDILRALKACRIDHIIM